MANVVYPKYKEAALSSASNSSLMAGNIKVALIDTGAYTYSAAHQFYTDLAGVVADSANLTGVTVTDGLLDADNGVLTSVSGVESEALVFYIDTGTPATSRLVAYLDTGAANLPVTPNGGNIDLEWNAAGIVQF